MSLKTPAAGNAQSSVDVAEVPWTTDALKIG